MWYLPVLLKNHTKKVDRADPKFAHIMSHSAISKVIMPLVNAVKIKTLDPVLVCNIMVTTVHQKIL